MAAVAVISARLISARLVAAAVVAHLVSEDVDAFLSQGSTPPRGKTVVVHPITPAAVDGPLGDPGQDLTMEYQTTSIGATVDQCLWTHDTVAAALWHATVSGDDWTTHPMWLVPGGSSPVVRDDDLATPMYTVAARWMAHAIPD